MPSDVTLRIKNLSISLEAISRINNEGSADLYCRIETLLTGEINEATKERRERATATTPDEDIPF